MTLEPEDSRKRLDGWKEIASHVGRSVRTAQRWERQYGMPVRRVVATNGEVVHGNAADIDTWLNQTKTLREGDSRSDATADANSQPQLSAPTQLDKHLAYGLAQACLFGFMVSEGLISEMAYGFERDGGLAMRLAPVAFLWAAGAVALAFWVDQRLVRRRQPHGLWVAMGTFLVAMGLLVIGLLPWLPADATIQATFQTRSIQSGYLKNVLYYFVPVVAALVLPTFHAVIALESEAATGDRANVAQLLRRTPGAIPLAGTPLPRPFHIAVILVIATIWIVAATNYLLDRLMPGPHSNLYSLLLEVRVGTWFAIGITATAWYAFRLDALLQRTVSR